MAWWQWIVLGILIVVEMITEREFDSLLLAVPAFALGLAGLGFLAIPPWGQWLVFSTGVAAFACFQLTSFPSKGRSAADRGGGVIGEIAIAQEAIAPGRFGHVELRGTTWTARNIGDELLRPRERARVERLTGLTVLVRPEI